MDAYVPLWCKSNFSFLTGASHPEELVERAHDLGIPLSITDRDGRRPRSPISRSREKRA